MENFKRPSLEDNTEEGHNDFLKWYARVGGNIAAAKYYIKNLQTPKEE